MPTLKQKRTLKNIAGNVKKSLGKAMREEGYSKSVSKSPKILTESKGWKELMEEHLPDSLLTEKHKELLNATRLEHMVFPTKTSDKDIRKLLESVNCNVRKIQHGDTAIHVWFWAKDNLALKNALDMGYKLKGRYAPEKIKLIDDKFDDYSNEEIEDEIKRRKDGGIRTSPVSEE